ncbi:MAG: flavin reductase family protein [Lentisphaerae bacterium]|nr:flavin reductase family protein [Lentisphaerota bacterium]
MRTIDYKEAILRKFPEQIAVAVSLDKKNNRANIITLGWVMCTSHNPPMLAISVGLTRYSHQTLLDAGEFVVAFPSGTQKEATLFCGTNSGRDIDKFKESGFICMPASVIKTPLIKDACANFECKLTATCLTGDHTIFTGEVVASHVNSKDCQRIYTMNDGSMHAISGHR